VDITESAGPGFAPRRPARGLATGDLDADGRPEIVIVNMNDTPTLLKNLGPRRNAIAITLAGTRSNRSAIGARCAIESRGRKQIADVVSGGSFFSQNSLTLYFGLGGAAAVDRIKVRWPRGETQTWTKVAANQTVLLTEGSAAIGSKEWVRTK
jgi:enediyne biosynthesis protein E4